MERTDAELLARSLMKEWNCEGWRFVWSNGKRQLGAVVQGVVPGTAGHVRLRVTTLKIPRGSKLGGRGSRRHPARNFSY